MTADIVRNWRGRQHHRQPFQPSGIWIMTCLLYTPNDTLVLFRSARTNLPSLKGALVTWAPTRLCLANVPSFFTAIALTLVSVDFWHVFVVIFLSVPFSSAGAVLRAHPESTRGTGKARARSPALGTCQFRAADITPSTSSITTTRKSNPMVSWRLTSFDGRDVIPSRGI